MPAARRARSAHPIQVVVRRTGLSADVIRAWEKRYAVVTPSRAPNGRRLYSDADIERLRLLARATLTGRTIGQLATLSPRELEAAARDDRVEHSPSPARDDAPALPEMAGSHLRAVLAAAERFDAVAIDAALHRALVALPADVFLDRVVVPFRRRMTELGSKSAFPAPHRHLALTTLRRMLHWIAEIGQFPVAGPQIVVATPAGQPDELGALLTAAAAVAEGWRVAYVGPMLSAEDIAATVSSARARAVAIGLGATKTDRSIGRELRRLGELLPREVPILVEGSAAAAHVRAIRGVDGTVLRDLSALRGRLRALRGD